MSPDDIARELIGESPSWAVEAGAQEGIAVGLTWAALIPADQDDFDQDALERANAKSMEELLEGVSDESEWGAVASYIVVRILDIEGNVTPEGREAAQAMAGLADYPVLDDEKHSEIQMLGWEYDWEEEVKNDVERGFIDVWERGGREQYEVIDELPKDWEDKVLALYSGRESETPMNDRGYHSVNRQLVVEILAELGYLQTAEGEEE